MEMWLWACLLCLQGCLLTHALDCADGDADCAPGLVSSVTLRVRRHTEPDRERRAHLSHANQPGAFSAKGFPNTLIQADRSRRHLNSHKKKQQTRKSRFGTYSLLSHNSATPFQVVRARRHSGDAGVPHPPPLKTVKQNSRTSTARKRKRSKVAICS